MLALPVHRLAAVDLAALSGGSHWQVAFECEVETAAPSRFVRLDVTVHLEVVDEQAVRAAAYESLKMDLGKDGKEPDPFLLTDLASCVGHAVPASNLLTGVPGVRPTGSSSSAGYFMPNAP
ncbi:MAG: hypothetical protein ACR2K2_12805 [Mycobacteriales bacterium]